MCRLFAVRPGRQGNACDLSRARGDQADLYTLPGWRSSTRGISRFDDLPERARAYLNFLEEKAGVEMGGISTGPERNETIIRAGSELERLIT